MQHIKMDLLAKKICSQNKDKCQIVEFRKKKVDVDNQPRKISHNKE